ncbi:MAG TPA: hypothetical protein VNA20_03290 [Frankiaceae bacterium]|nr:hypothetical protein [Frankiaceae bacterium]
MSRTETLTRTMHDVGLAAWFGGSLMGAVGVNGAARDVDDPRQRAQVANAGWGRWTPVNLAAIGAHVVGALDMTRANKGRMAAQKGVPATAFAKAALTGVALGATAYSRVLGQKVMNAGPVPVAGATESLPTTPEDVAKAQQQLKALQWLIPALTGSLLGMNSLMGEQQRPKNVVRGMARRAIPGKK